MLFGATSCFLLFFYIWWSKWSTPGSPGTCSHYVLKHVREVVVYAIEKLSAILNLIKTCLASIYGAANLWILFLKDSRYWHLVSPLVYRGPWMSTVVLYCWCRSDSASVLLYFTLKASLTACPDPIVSVDVLCQNIGNIASSCLFIVLNRLIYVPMHRYEQFHSPPSGILGR